MYQPFFIRPLPSSKPTTPPPHPNLRPLPLIQTYDPLTLIQTYDPLTLIQTYDPSPSSKPTNIDLNKNTTAFVLI